MIASFIYCSKGDRVDRLAESVKHLSGIQLAIELVKVTGAHSMAEGLNDGVKKAKSDVLVFTHDDVELVCSTHQFLQAVYKAEEKKTGVVGVAGAYRLGADGCWWGRRDSLCGGLYHADGNGSTWVNTYGPFGRVIALDGVFLIMRRGVYEFLHGFDNEYPGWHFYDVDLTLRAHAEGFRNYAFPLPIVHYSLGEGALSGAWADNRLLLQKKRGKLLPAAISEGEL